MNMPEDLKSVLAEIEAVTCVGRHRWYKVVYYCDGHWNSFADSKTFQDGEQVARWYHIDELMRHDELAAQNERLRFAAKEVLYHDARGQGIGYDYAMRVLAKRIKESPAANLARHDADLLQFYAHGHSGPLADQMREKAKKLLASVK